MKKILNRVLSKTPSAPSFTNVESNTDTKSQTLTFRKPLEDRHREGRPSSVIIDIDTPTLSSSSTVHHKRVRLVEASSATFGNECLRLVNIVFRTSQTFQSMMGTCGHISQYLRKELFKKYLGEHFQIIIGRNKAFGFAVADGDYFAEMEQEQYRVIIFSTKLDRKMNLATHDANSQMMLEWKLVE